SISTVVRYSRVRTEEFTVVGADRPPLRFPTIFCPRSKITSELIGCFISSVNGSSCYPWPTLAVTDLLGGQVQVMFAPTPPSIEHIRSGKRRALAVTTATRSDAFPDIPTVGEFVPGYEASNWYGVGIPKNTPADIVDKLNKEINAGLADPKIKA